MKFEIGRLKVPTVFLMMTLAALAVVVFIGSGSGDADEDITQPYSQQASLDEDDVRMDLVFDEEA